MFHLSPSSIERLFQPQVQTLISANGVTSTKKKCSDSYLHRSWSPRRLYLSESNGVSQVGLHQAPERSLPLRSCQDLDSVAALQRLCSSSSGIGSLVNERWSLVRELEAEARKRDSDTVMLNRELEALQRDYSRLSKHIKSAAQKPSPVNKHADNKVLATATPSALLQMFKVASASVHDFAELIASSMAVSSDADAGEQSWRRYALEAHLSRTMLGATTTGTEEEQQEEAGLKISAGRFDRIMRFCDPMEALMLYPSSSFSRFCRSRYLAAVPPGTEAAVLGNLDQRAFVSRGGHPRTCFYRAFATMARSAWALHGAHGVMRMMFYARRGSDYAEEWMQSVRDGGDMDEKLSSVAFTVTPGVKVGDTVVKCRVLLLCRHQERFIQVQ